MLRRAVDHKMSKDVKFLWNKTIIIAQEFSQTSKITERFFPTGITFF